jgi:hypothetical protein
MNTFITGGTDIVGSQPDYRPLKDSCIVKLLHRLNYQREGIFSE